MAKVTKDILIEFTEEEIVNAIKQYASELTGEPVESMVLGRDNPMPKIIIDVKVIEEVEE